MSIWTQRAQSNPPALLTMSAARIDVTAKAVGRQAEAYWPTTSRRRRNCGPQACNWNFPLPGPAILYIEAEGTQIPTPTNTDEEGTTRVR
jgi:hypothetical protein